MEEYISGRTDNLHDYLIPTVGDIPPITTYIIEDPEPIAPYGAKGVGEPALIATAPAIFGAVRQATGVRVDFAPCTPDRLRRLLRMRTVFDLTRDLAGKYRGGVSDLATNPKHMEGFGE